MRIDEYNDNSDDDDIFMWPIEQYTWVFTCLVPHH